MTIFKKVAFYLGKINIFKVSASTKYIKKRWKCAKKSMQMWNKEIKAKRTSKKWIWGGLGLHLEGFWDAPGRLLATFGHIWVDFWTFKSISFSSMGPRWGPKGLLNGFGIAFGRVGDDFGRVWGGISKDLGPFNLVVDRFGKCLASFRPAGANSLNRTPALIREASQLFTKLTPHAVTWSNKIECEVM